MVLRRGRLADIQAQQVEVGRIRLGTSETRQSRQGKDYQAPVKLERFRLTSRSEQLIREAAELYGGEVEPWIPQSGGAQQWELVIASTSIPVIVPPDACSQYYEQWTAGKCTRRCDGLRELLGETPCVCGPDPDQKKQSGCKPTTRLSLMLANMNGIGIWRLESHGYYAAAELPAVADLLSAAGGNIEARLEMEERSAQVPDPRDPGKTVTSRFMVPVLHVEATPAAIIGTFGSRQAIETGPARQAIEAGTVGEEELPPLKPIPGSLAPDEEEETRQQWVLHSQYEDAINQATARDPMMALREQLKNDTRLQDSFKENLGVLWNDRAKALVAAGSPPPAPAAAQTAAASAPAAPPGTPGLDRNSVWRDVNMVAGFRNLKLSQLKQMFGEWSNGGTDLTRATAEDLLGFRDWLKAQPQS